MSSEACSLGSLRSSPAVLLYLTAESVNTSLFIFLHIFCLQTALDEAFISVYNLCYTSLPVLALGFFDQDVKPQLTFKVSATSSTFYQLDFSALSAPEAVPARPAEPLLQLQRVRGLGCSRIHHQYAPVFVANG